MPLVNQRSATEFNTRGPFNNALDYNTNDRVSHNGMSYVAPEPIPAGEGVPNPGTNRWIDDPGSEGLPGGMGIKGDSVRAVYIRSVTVPANPTGTWDGATLTLQGGWSETVSSGTDPLYRSDATLDNAANTATFTPAERWTGPVGPEPSDTRLNTLIQTALNNADLQTATQVNAAIQAYLQANNYRTDAQIQEIINDAYANVLAELGAVQVEYANNPSSEADWSATNTLYDRFRIRLNNPDAAWHVVVIGSAVGPGGTTTGLPLTFQYATDSTDSNTYHDAPQVGTDTAYRFKAGDGDYGPWLSIGGTGSGSTNLNAAATATYVEIISDTGNDARIDGATSTHAGVLTRDDKRKLDTLDPLPAQATRAEILAAILADTRLYSPRQLGEVVEYFAPGGQSFRHIRVSRAIKTSITNANDATLTQALGSEYNLTMRAGNDLPSDIFTHLPTGIEVKLLPVDNSLTAWEGTLQSITQVGSTADYAVRIDFSTVGSTLPTDSGVRVEFDWTYLPPIQFQYTNDISDSSVYHSTYLSTDTHQRMRIGGTGIWSAWQTLPAGNTGVSSSLQFSVDGITYADTAPADWTRIRLIIGGSTYNIDFSTADIAGSTGVDRWKGPINALTTYARGDMVWIEALKGVFISRQDNNVGNVPVDTARRTEWWDPLSGRDVTGIYEFYTASERQPNATISYNVNGTVGEDAFLEPDNSENFYDAIDLIPQTLQHLPKWRILLHDKNNCAIVVTEEPSPIIEPDIVKQQRADLEASFPVVPLNTATNFPNFAAWLFHRTITPASGVNLVDLSFYSVTVSQQGSETSTVLEQNVLFTSNDLGRLDLNAIATRASTLRFSHNVSGRISVRVTGVYAQTQGTLAHTPQKMTVSGTGYAEIAFSNSYNHIQWSATAPNSEPMVRTRGEAIFREANQPGTSTHAYIVVGRLEPGIGLTPVLIFGDNNDYPSIEVKDAHGIRFNSTNYRFPTDGSYYSADNLLLHEVFIAGWMQNNPGALSQFQVFANEVLSTSAQGIQPHSAGAIDLHATYCDVMGMFWTDTLTANAVSNFSPNVIGNRFGDGLYGLIHRKASVPGELAQPDDGEDGEDGEIGKSPYAVSLSKGYASSQSVLAQQVYIDPSQGLMFLNLDGVNETEKRILTNLPPRSYVDVFTADNSKRFQVQIAPGALSGTVQTFAFNAANALVDKGTFEVNDSLTLGFTAGGEPDTLYSADRAFTDEQVNISFANGYINDGNGRLSGNEEIFELVSTTRNTVQLRVKKHVEISSLSAHNTLAPHTYTMRVFNPASAAQHRSGLDVSLHILGDTDINVGNIENNAIHPIEINFGNSYIDQLIGLGSGAGNTVTHSTIIEQDTLLELRWRTNHNSGPDHEFWFDPPGNYHIRFTLTGRHIGGPVVKADDDGDFATIQSDGTEHKMMNREGRFIGDGETDIGRIIASSGQVSRVANAAALDGITTTGKIAFAITQDTDDIYYHVDSWERLTDFGLYLQSVRVEYIAANAASDLPHSNVHGSRVVLARATASFTITQTPDLDVVEGDFLLFTRANDGTTAWVKMFNIYQTPTHRVIRELVDLQNVPPRGEIVYGLVSPVLTQDPANRILNYTDSQNNTVTFHAGNIITHNGTDWIKIVSNRVRVEFADETTPPYTWSTIQSQTATFMRITYGVGDEDGDADDFDYQFVISLAPRVRVEFSDQQLSESWADTFDPAVHHFMSFVINGVRTPSVQVGFDQYANFLRGYDIADETFTGDIFAEGRNTPFLENARIRDITPLNKHFVEVRQNNRWEYVFNGTSLTITNRGFLNNNNRLVAENTNQFGEGFILSGVSIQLSVLPPGTGDVAPVSSVPIAGAAAVTFPGGSANSRYINFASFDAATITLTNGQRLIITETHVTNPTHNHDDVRLVGNFAGHRSYQQGLSFTYDAIPTEIKTQGQQLVIQNPNLPVDERDTPFLDEVTGRALFTDPPTLEYWRSGQRQKLYPFHPVTTRFVSWDPTPKDILYGADETDVAFLSASEASYVQDEIDPTGNLIDNVVIELAPDHIFDVRCVYAQTAAGDNGLFLQRVQPLIFTLSNPGQSEYLGCFAINNRFYWHRSQTTGTNDTIICTTTTGDPLAGENLFVARHTGLRGSCVDTIRSKIFALENTQPIRIRVYDLDTSSTQQVEATSELITLPGNIGNPYGIFLSDRDELAVILNNNTGTVASCRFFDMATTAAEYTDRRINLPNTIDDGDPMTGNSSGFYRDGGMLVMPDGSKQFYFIADNNDLIIYYDASNQTRITDKLTQLATTDGVSHTASIAHEFYLLVYSAESPHGVFPYLHSGEALYEHASDNGNPLEVGDTSGGISANVQIGPGFYRTELDVSGENIKTTRWNNKLYLRAIRVANNAAYLVIKKRTI